jgi:hypothetical protein
MAIVRAIGYPENESEREAIAYLAANLAGDDIYIYHNLELPAHSGLPYEYDMIVTGQYAVYVVEVKGYQGTIRGNAYEWELESGAIYRSPIPLSNKKAKVVADHLRRANPQLGHVWVQPVILLTDNRAQILLNDEQADRVLTLDRAPAYFSDPRCLPIHAKPITELGPLIDGAILEHFGPLHRHHEIGQYRVLETIGRNDLYTTLMATHSLIETRNRFTLKVYSFDVYADPETRHKQEKHLLRDANALHRLEGHPNIVRAYMPFPWEDNKYVLPLDWIDGYSLRGLLDAGETFTLERALDIVRQACEGLAYVHSQGVIHRDIRPDNIIIPHEGPIKLVNFDCARVSGDKMETIATRVGRRLDPRYVAPEVWYDAGAASECSDLYALGIVLFELLTGQPPYEKLGDVFANNGLPRLPSQLKPGLPAALDAIVERMCALLPAERYSGMGEALEDLRAIG